MSEREPIHPAERTPEPKRPGRWAEMAQNLWQRLKNNWGWKLLSLVLALVLWAVLITQDPTLTREKVFTGATASLVGSENVKRNGFIVTSDLTGLLSDITLRVEVPQLQYTTAQASNYNLRVDLSRITEAGEQDLRLLTTSSTTYGTVTAVEPATVHAQVEEYITRYRIPVTVYTTGEPADGWYAGEPSADLPLVAISGPRSTVSSVARVEAVLDLSGLPTQEGTVRTSVPLTLIDADGLPVSNSLVEITNESVLVDSVVVDVRMLPAREVSLGDVGLVVGAPEDGYEIKSVTLTPASVTAAGLEEYLDGLDAIYAEATVDVSGLSASVTRRLQLAKPYEIEWLSASAVTVAVEIAPVIGSRTFRDVPVRFTGAESLSGVYSETKTVDVTISEADMPWLNSLTADDLSVTCDVSGLAKGAYQLPLVCEVGDSAGRSYLVAVSPERMTVEVE